MGSNTLVTIKVTNQSRNTMRINLDQMGGSEYPGLFCEGADIPAGLFDSLTGSGVAIGLRTPDRNSFSPKDQSWDLH